MKHKKAFTLIELLVVIAIIAILAAILFPVFAQAKSAAKKAGSISNLKQFGLASKMYENDYDDYITPAQYCTDYAVDANNNATHLLTWENTLYPYIKNGENVTDPNHGTGNGSPDRNKASGIWADPGAPNTQSFPYGIHFRLAPDNWGTSCPGGTPGDPAPSVSETVVPSPSDTILIMTKGQTEVVPSDPDTGWGWVYFIADEYGWCDTVGSNPPATEVDTFVPNGGNSDCDGLTGASGYVWAGCGMLPRYRYAHTCPVAFTDGHAKAMSKGSISFSKNIYANLPGQGIW